MAQAAFTFDTPVVAATGGDSTSPAATGGSTATPFATSHGARPQGRDGSGFEIGWDLAHYRLTPPVAHLHAENPVRQGWSAGRAVFGARTLKPSRAVRQWLQLRLAAWQHGLAFEAVQVVPNYLTQLQADECPVTRTPLAASDGTEPTITRLNTAAGVAAGNLVMLSQAALTAKADHRWDSALANARRIEAGECTEIDGLNAIEWARLALLISLVTPLAHAQAATLPLWVLPPNRVRVLNPVQALQVMLTLQFCEAGYARRLVALAVLMPSSEARQAFQVFMHTLLARRLSAGPVLDGAAARRAMETAWADALVQRRWQRLALLLTSADCEQLLQRAARRGLMGAGKQWLNSSRATEGWALETAGQASCMAAADGVVSAKAMSH
ncbi:hypothetical protein [Aquabacterium sp.]|uniref:hypothetical protein n=1 Tax=Aquabacterium sp. TaxID=1872578 RepID=UPI002C6F9F54|nr:hypothetical protein [Aquabacterium sp.]HSW05572.1 hypothetical protein [Aquabacterium sp.]